MQVRRQLESARASPPSIAMFPPAMSDSPVSIHPYFQAHAGKLEAVKALLPRFVQQTAHEPGMLHYEFTMNGDMVFCREAYANGDAALAHIENVGELLAEMLRNADLVRIEFHGPANELAKMREPLAHLNAAWFERAVGVERT
jgi:quinol monooxygenase YgiN